MQVFISSTCYDLIDLRAELEEFFRNAGVEARLSDSPTSEFQVTPEDKNSIETCLANVRACDEFVIILSRRYGPSLVKAGYEDLSATHLEYREAVKAKKPIRMYVRDKLDGEYGVWRANQKGEDLKFVWCKEPHDQKLFRLLEEHRDLFPEKLPNNWIWLFSDSTDLKRRLAKDFRSTFNRVKIERLSEEGRIPFIEISGKFLHPTERRCFHFELLFRNLSTAAALSPLLELETSSNQTSLKGILGQQELCVKMHWYAQPYSNDIKLSLRLSYSISEGHQFLDEGVLTVHYDPKESSVSYQPKKRRYLGLASGMTVLTDAQENLIEK